jgi:hypothetical protein
MAPPVPPSGRATRLGSAREAFFLALKHGLPPALVRFHGGIGDHLLCTVLAREWHKRHRSKLWLMSDHAELFAGNPDPGAIVPEDMRLLKLAQAMRVPQIDPTYAPTNFAEDRQARPDGHIIAKMCRLAGLTGEVELRPYFYLENHEREKGAVVERQIAIISSGQGARHPFLTKEWYPERFQAVVESLKSDYRFVQLGSAADPPLTGAVDLRGKTSLRESAAILARSLLYLGTVGFLMHLARAVECPAVIVYGGRELPAESGYTCNGNLSTPIECSPCWLLNSCPYDRECMKRIGVEEVVSAVRRRVATAAEKPLVVDRAVIS